jgi:hypothetical protein
LRANHLRTETLWRHLIAEGNHEQPGKASPNMICLRLNGS